LRDEFPARLDSMRVSKSGGFIQVDRDEIPELDG
jgi:hypothetical protein